MGDGESGVGVAAPAGGAPPLGYRDLVSGCAVAAVPPASALELTGEDRARFLHGQITCDVKALGLGEGAYGFLLSPKGRVLADTVVSALADRLRVELPSGAEAAMAERLRRYVVADRVEIETRGGAEADLLVAGPAAAEALRPLLGGSDSPGGWDHVQVSAGEAVLMARGELRVGVPAWRLSGDRAAVDAAAADLRRAGVAEAGAKALEVVRVERGLPRSGVDYDERHFPQETGLEEWAVSYTKGCYIGQEVVARIHYRGRANHQLRGLEAAADAPVPPSGALADAAGEAAGTLTSAVWSPACGRAVGLAVLHRRWADPGTRLLAADGTEMEVVTLPFDTSTRNP